MKAQDVCRPAIMLASDRTLQDLRNVLLKYRISRVVIEERGLPIGIVTEKDVSRFLYSGITDRPLHKIGVRELLPTRELVSVKRLTGLAECARKMLEHGISSLVVKDYGEKTIGIFTHTDLLDFYIRRLSGKAAVGQYMSTNVHTVRPDDSVTSALALLTGKGISRVIVALHGKSVGIITGRDLLRVIPLLHGSIDMKKVYIPTGTISTIEVANVMKPNPLTVREDLDLADAAMMMKGNRISGLPVVNSDDELVGVITSTDVIRAISEMERSA